MLAEFILFGLAALVVYALNVIYKPIERIGNQFRSDRIIWRKSIGGRLTGGAALFLISWMLYGIMQLDPMTHIRPHMDIGTILFSAITILLLLYLMGPDDIIIYPQTMTYVRSVGFVLLFRVTRGPTDDLSSIYVYNRPNARRLPRFEVHARWRGTNNAAILLHCNDYERARSFALDMSQLLNMPYEGVLVEKLRQ